MWATESGIIGWANVRRSGICVSSLGISTTSDNKIGDRIFVGAYHLVWFDLYNCCERARSKVFSP